MSSTTTIRMPEQLKSRIHEAAKHTGVSAHSIIIQAVEEKADKLEQQAAFYDEADQRFTQLVKTGEKVSWDDMQAYLETLIGSDEVASIKTTKMAD